MKRFFRILGKVELLILVLTSALWVMGVSIHSDPFVNIVLLLAYSNGSVVVCVIFAYLINSILNEFTGGV